MWTVSKEFFNQRRVKFINLEYCIRITSDENICELAPSNAVNQLAIYKNDRFISNIPSNFNDFEHCFSFGEIKEEDVLKIQATSNGVSN